MSLQSLINYRVQLKEEGASEAHLKNYDGEINQVMLSKSDKPDISLINYRLQRTKEGAPFDEISTIDSHIFKSFGTTPARFADIKIRTIINDFHVSVDLNRETVGDLYTRVSYSVGKSPKMIKLIFKGRHIEFYEDRTLYEIGIDETSEVGICFKLGCDGRGCCDSAYNRLCDSLLRSTESAIKNLTKEEQINLLSVFSKLEAVGELDKLISEKKKELEKLEKPKLFSESLLYRLVSESDESELRCEAQCKPLSNMTLNI